MSSMVRFGFGPSNEVKQGKKKMLLSYLFQIMPTRLLEMGVQSFLVKLTIIMVLQNIIALLMA